MDRFTGKGFTRTEAFLIRCALSTHKEWSLYYGRKFDTADWQHMDVYFW